MRLYLKETTVFPPESMGNLANVLRRLQNKFGMVLCGEFTLGTGDIIMFTGIYSE
jgi:hypothetical protein